MIGDEIFMVGSSVVFVDANGKEHDALVTHVFGEGYPSINLVYVSSDESRTDQYGRQIERNTSVVHENNQHAGGMYWRQP